MMKEMLRIRSIVNPAVGISEVEFSPMEVNRFRNENINARKSHKDVSYSHDQDQ
ncbi:MAG: hypothetical protein PHY48_16465 [Candidatus Cloacimonetes bacterium]|nr:hypothetical protein [Candidatus Cloacimonadota bacterium]